MTTNQKIETSREIRLWITGIISPLIIGGATILANNPDLRVQLWLKSKQMARSLKKKLTFCKKKERKREVT